MDTFNVNPQQSDDSQDLDLSKELAHVTQEMYKKNLELSQKNKTLSLLRKIDAIILSSATNIEQIAQRVADVVIEDEEDIKAVEVMLVNKQEQKLVRLAISRTGSIKKAESAVKRPLLDMKIPLSNTSNIAVRAIFQRKMNMTKNLLEILTPHFTEEEAKKIQAIIGSTSSFVYPLIARTDAIGAMIISIDEKENSLSYFQLDLIDRLPGIVAIAIDNALLYRELQGANVKLQEIDKLKDEFVSLASHELRTPMTIISSYLWLMLNKDNVSLLSEKQKMYLDRAYISTQRLINLVNDMLNVSRIESGRLTLTIKPIDIVELVNTVYVEILPKAQESQINLEFVKPQEVLPKVQADPERIEQVLINLIGNSLKFTKVGGTIKISITNNIFQKTAMVSVADNGKGISEEDMPKLFQKFSMVGNNYLVKKSTQGTGLGLYLSKSIIDLHGGKIWAESEGEGKGSRFSFTLKTVV